MADNSHLFEDFRNLVVTDSDQDGTRLNILRRATENGLTVAFNKIGETGGATVLPPENQVTVNLKQDSAGLWRVKNAR
ncbi:MAG: hypothetical protein ACK4PK_08190 [Alphaproteobacteria bacterium]